MENERNNLAAPCGLDCGICEVYISKDNPELLKYLVSVGLPEDKLPCPGCRSLEGDCPVISEKCATYSCADEKGLSFCFECDEFPCIKLQPAVDRANVLPHNMKVFNLCIIQKKGVEEFIKEAGKIKEKYYTGKMEVGKGPIG